MPDIAGILSGTRNEIVYDLPWPDYCSAVAMNPSTLVRGMKPNGSMKALKWGYDHSGDVAPKAPAGPLVWGRALHCLLFERDEFLSRYFLWPTRRAGKEYDAFADEAAAAGAEVLNQAQWDSVIAAGNSIASCDAIKPLINSGKAEVSLFTVEEVEDHDGEMHQIGMKHRLDWVNGSPCLVADLKSTRNVNSRGFSRDFYSYHYSEKLGLYQRALEKLTGVKYPVKIIVLEKKPPFETCIMPVADEVLDRGAKKALKVLRDVAQSIKTGVWPGKSEEDLVLETPVWEMTDEEDVDYSEVA